jgi:hypothetical protein
MKRTSIELDIECIQILNDYKDHGFTTKNDMIEKAVKDMLLQQNFQYLSNTIINDFADVFNEQYIGIVNSLEELMKESNRQLIKYKYIFLNQFLGFDHLPSEIIHKKYYKKASDDINADRDTLKLFMEVNKVE